MIKLAFDFLTNNLGTKLISLLIAFVIWVYVLESQQVEVAVQVPVQYLTDSNMAVTSNRVTELDVLVAVPKAFLRLINQQSVVQVNLTGYKVGTLSYRFFPENLTLPPGTRVLSIKPEQVKLNLEEVKKVSIPVRLELAGTPPPNFKIGKAWVEPPSVLVSGAESKIREIKEVLSRPVNVTGAEADIDTELELDLERFGLTLMSPPPHAKIEIIPNGILSRYRLKNIEVHVSANGNYRLNDRTVTVFVKATQEDLRTLSKKKVFVEIDVRGLTKGNYKREVKVRLPKNITLEKVAPDQVSVTVF